jgi:hypothetical protein
LNRFGFCCYDDITHYPSEEMICIKVENGDYVSVSKENLHPLIEKATSDSIVDKKLIFEMTFNGTIFSLDRGEGIPLTHSTL